MRRLLVPALLGLLGACGTSAATGTDPTFPSHKAFVCKYVGTPGLDERLQTGDNPISVDISSLANFVALGDFFNDEQGRSVAIAFDVGQPEPGVEECPSVTTTTTTSMPSTTSSTSTTSSLPPTTSGPTTSGPTTTFPTPTPFAIEVEPLCPDGTVPLIAITFGDRTDLDGLTGTLSFSTGGSVTLTYEVGATVEIPYPASAGTGPVTMTYTLGAESVTRSTSFPEACAPATTSTTVPGGTTTTSTIPGDTTTSTTIPNGTTTTTPDDEFAFGAATTVCVREVPTITIEFLNTFPELAGEVGILTMADLDGTVVSTQPLTYQPNTTVRLLYPGTRVNADGSIADVPGWILNEDGVWVRDPSDERLRDGIDLTYTINPTATARITYPPESSACATPNNTTTTTTSPPATTTPPTTVPGLPVTR